MIYYKKLNGERTVAEVGTATERVTDGIEITKEEYDRLHGKIVEQAVHILPVEGVEEQP